MLGAFLGGVLGRMLKRCLSDAIFRIRFKYKKIPLLVWIKSRTPAIVLIDAKRGVF